MQIFLDTANIDQIRTAASWGVIDGVTTNPTLVSQEKGKSFQEIIKEIISIVKGPISVEAISLKAEEMIKEAREFSSWAPQIVIKIPLTKEGLKAVKTVSAEKIKTNVTLVFSPNQALLAAKAGATYVSPFIGRLDDVSQEGARDLELMVKIFKKYNFSTQIIAASVRHPIHVVNAALMGCDIATVPFNVLEKMFNHPLTDIGIERFLKDWEKVSTK
jgi:transaldolase